METKGIERRIKERMLTTRQPRLDRRESLPWTAWKPHRGMKNRERMSRLKRNLGVRERERERAKAEGWGRRTTPLRRLRSPPSPSRRRETKKKKAERGGVEGDEGRRRRKKMKKNERGGCRQVFKEGRRKALFGLV